MQSVDPRFVSLTDADIDVVIAEALAELGLAELAASRADFDLADEAIPGSGSAAWKFMHSGILTAATALQGAASFSAGLCPDVVAAARHLDGALDRYSCSITTFSGFVSDMRIYGDDPRPALERAGASVVELRAFLKANPDQFSNRVRLRTIIRQTLRAVSAARATIDELTGPDGKARPLDGASGFFPPLTLDGYLRFLEGCATRGVECLPPGEAGTADGLLSILGAKFAHQRSVGPEIAAYLALGDTGQESELFGGGALRMSEVLQTAVPHHWQRIDLTSSPLVQACGATVQ